MTWGKPKPPANSNEARAEELRAIAKEVRGLGIAVGAEGKRDKIVEHLEALANAKPPAPTPAQQNADVRREP